MKVKIGFVLGGFALLTGCAAAISSESLKQADPNITFQALVKDPERYRGKIVLLGGQIITTTVREKETWVEVLQQPLDWQHRPQDTDVSYGRFLVHFGGFLDPAIYAAGKKVTVLGEVQGKRVQTLKEMESTYPVLLPREHHLWKPESSSGPFFHIGIGIGGVIR